MADAPKKLSTQDILAKARAEAARARGEAPPEAAGDSPAPEAASPAPVAESRPEPKTTAEKLAAARSAASESPAAKPAADKPAAGAKPKSTAEILAAARAEKAAGAAKAEQPAAEAAAEKPAAKPAAAKADAPAGGKPRSTADILAAARAEKAKAAGAGQPAAVSESKPAPAAKPGAKKAATAAVAEGMSVEQMLAAVRPAEVAPAKAAPVKAVTAPPPMPSRPVPAKKVETPRRNVLLTLIATPFALAWTLFGLWATGASLLVARFMLPNVLTEPPRKFKIGPPSDYDLGTVSTKWVAAFGIWIVHTDQYQGKNLIYALASVCTHLGCTPSWLEGEQKFKCPCHGSGFYITGVNFEGPAPRPLERVGLRVAEDGMLEVDKSLKFQEEMGQWKDGASFVEVA